MKLRAELIAELEQKTEALEGCIKFQDSVKNDPEINALADKLAEEIKAIEKLLNDFDSKLYDDESRN